MRREVYGFILGVMLSIAALALALYVAGMSMLEFGVALLAIDLVWVLSFYYYARKHASQPQRTVANPMRHIYK
ncbi:hypothetical protein PQ610_01625 [Tardisphaera miroshnichenkoae]